MKKEYQYISFDCYGTLIDWELGILQFFESFKKRYNLAITDQEVLRLYAQFEATAEHGSYRPYREILKTVLQNFADYFSITLKPDDAYSLAESVKLWPPFEDCHEALRSLQEKYKLVVISNIDDDLFACSEKQMGIKFDYVFTAYQMKSYKPSQYNFKYVQKALQLNKDNWLHVAQSLYHDHEPISKLGIDSVWIKRLSKAGDQGVAPVVNCRPLRIYESLAAFTKDELIKE